MPKLQKRDFYFGAALSLFFRSNSDAKPSLIESVDEHTQVLYITTDTSDDFYIIMKYTSAPRFTKKENNISWGFPLSTNDKNIINKYINNDIYILLICGMEELKNSEIAVLTKDDYMKISNKNSITIRLKGKRPHDFLIHYGKSEDETFKINRNRIVHKFNKTFK